MEGRVHGWRKGCIGGWKDAQMKRRMHKWNGRKYAGLERRTYRGKEECMDGWKRKFRDESKAAWMYGKVPGYKKGFVDG